MLLFVSVNN